MEDISDETVYDSLTQKLSLNSSHLFTHLEVLEKPDDLAVIHLEGKIGNVGGEGRVPWHSLRVHIRLPGSSWGRGQHQTLRLVAIFCWHGNWFMKVLLQCVSLQTGTPKNTCLAHNKLSMTTRTHQDTLPVPKSEI